MSDNELLDKITNKNRALLNNWFKTVSTNDDIKNYLINRYSEKIPQNKQDFREIIHRIIHKIDKYPKCPICGKYTITIHHDTCGNKECSNKLRYQKQCETNIEKYGVKNQFSRKEIIDYMSTPEMQIKREKGFEKRYGKNIKNPSDIKEVVEKRKQTFTEKYGEGITNPSQVKEYREKAIRSTLERFGTKTVLTLPENREKRKTKESIQREYETKRKNGSLGVSLPEKRFFEKLKEIYPQTIHQHRNNKIYPFNCDFYIPEIDTWIEYQGFWTHGDHPFNENNIEDIEILKEWEEKAEFNEFYKSAVNVWTLSDPYKRIVAKNNNLNWLEFFTEEEFNNWIEKQRR